MALVLFSDAWRSCAAATLTTCVASDLTSPHHTSLDLTWPHFTSSSHTSPCLTSPQISTSHLSLNLTTPPPTGAATRLPGPRWAPPLCTMNDEDRDIVRAERDADPERFRNYFREPANEEAESVRSSGSSSTHDAPPSSRRTASMASRTFTRTSTQIEDNFMHYLDRHPTAIQRMQDHRLQHSQTVGSSKRAPVDTSQLPSFGGNKPYPPPLPPSEDYVVEFDGHDDPRHAMNWPTNKKLYVSAILIFDSLAATFASSVFSPAATFVEEEFGKSREVVVLCTSLFVLGYAIGPSIFAPMSELYGRKTPIVIAAFAFGIFNMRVISLFFFLLLLLLLLFFLSFLRHPTSIYRNILTVF